MKRLKNETQINLNFNYTLKNNDITLKFIMFRSSYIEFKFDLCINGQLITKHTNLNDVKDSLEKFGLNETEIETLLTLIKYNVYDTNNLIYTLDEYLIRGQINDLTTHLLTIIDNDNPYLKNFPTNQDINFLDHDLKPEISITEYEDLSKHIETEGLEKFYNIKIIDDNEYKKIIHFIFSLILKYQKYHHYLNTSSIYIENTCNSNLNMVFAKTNSNKISITINECIPSEPYDIWMNNIALHNLDINDETLFKTVFKDIDSKKYMSDINDNDLNYYLNKPDFLIKQYNMNLKKKTVDKIDEITKKVLLEYTYHNKLPKMSNKEIKLLHLYNWLSDTKPNKRYKVTSVETVFNGDKYYNELYSNNNSVRIKMEDFFTMLKTLLKFM